MDLAYPQIGAGLMLFVLLALAGAVCYRLFGGRASDDRKVPWWFVGGLILSFLMPAVGYFFARGYVDSDLKLHFERKSQDLIRKLELSLRSSEQVCLFVARLFDASEEVTEDEFRLFADEGLKQHPEIRSVAFLERVRSEERETWENRHGPIWSPKGASDRANEERTEFLPIRYIAPADRDDLRGRDFWNDAAGSAYLESIGRGGDLGVSPFLLGDRGEGWDFWVVEPLYDLPLPPKSNDPWEHLSGFVVARYVLKDLLAQTLEGSDESLELMIRGETQSGTVKTVFSTLPDSEALDDFRLHTLTLGSERRWSVLLRPSDAGLAGLLAWLPTYALIGGWIAALMAALLLASVEERHIALKKLADERGRKLVDTERNFAAIVEAAPEALIVVSPSDRAILDANPFACRWFGLEIDEMTALKMDDLLSREEEATAETVLRPPTDDLPDRARYVRFQTHQSDCTEAEVTVSAIVYHGRPAIVLMARDISVVEHARRAAEIAGKAKNQFMASVSHEVRTPLSGILGMTQLAMEHDLNPALRENLETVESCAKELLATLDDVLDYSRLETGRVEIEPTSFDLRVVTHDALMHMVDRARSKGVVLVHHVRRDVPKILIGDALRVRQLLLNLLGSAIKRAKSGSIVLSLVPRATSDPTSIEILFTLSLSGTTGPGDPMKSVLEPFRSQAHGGNGDNEVRIALCHQLVEMMSGRIDISPSGDGRWKANFSIPFDRHAGSAPPAPREPFLGAHTLVLHSEPAFREALAESLLTLGSRARGAPDLMSALGYLDEMARYERHLGLILVEHHFALSDDFRGLAAAARRILPLQPTFVSVSHDTVATVPEGIALSLTFPLSLEQLAIHLEPIFECTGPFEPELEQPPKDESLPLRILLVEDNPVNRKLAATLLTRAGHHVDLAEHGGEAVDFLAKNEVDLVLMDVQMPVMDGLTATRKIRDELGLRKLPIIALTAHALPGDRELCLSAGMSAYITKPIEREELYKVLARWTHLPRTKGDPVS